MDHFNARYIAVAGFTLMIWTHLTRLDEEATYIWSPDARVTLNKALFTIVRYFTTIAFGFVLHKFDFPWLLANTTVDFTASVSHKYVPI